MNVPHHYIFKQKIYIKRSVFAWADCHAYFQERKLYSLLKGWIRRLMSCIHIPQDFLLLISIKVSQCLLYIGIWLRSLLYFISSFRVNERAGENPCIPRNETVQPPYFQNRSTMLCLPIPTFIYLWEINIFQGWVCLFCCSQICGQILRIYNSLTDTRMWKLEYKNGIFVAVCSKYLFASLRRTLVMSYDMISVGHHFLSLIGKKAHP